MSYVWFGLALALAIWLGVLYHAQAVDSVKAAQGFKSAADAVKGAFAKLRGKA